MPEKKKCFIIMPLTTPETFLSIYRGDKDHFEHVLDCLFIPALEKSNLKLIKPLAKGAELIHGRIIKHIETSDLVLCDISTLNPNVFFELGVRSALNKPLCLVKDDVTKKIPFDTSVINHHTYKSSLPSWEIQKEIDQLSEHIEDSIKTSKGINELWKYFGLSSVAYPAEEKGGVEDRLDYLTLQIESLKEKIQSGFYLQGAVDPIGATLQGPISQIGATGPVGLMEAQKKTIKDFQETAMELLMDYAEGKGVKISTYFIKPDVLTIYVKKGTLTNRTRNTLIKKANAFEFLIEIIEGERK